jgi:tol-pal system protein YbgF
LRQIGTILSSKQHVGLGLGAALLASLLCCAPVAADPARQSGDGSWQVAQAAAAPGGTGTPKSQGGAQAGADEALRQRVEQLEEQLVDMQVVVGTLESLATRGAPVTASPGGSPGGGGVDSFRVDGLETQVRALAAQLEQLTTQVRALAAAPPASAPAAQPAAPVPGATLPGNPAEQSLSLEEPAGRFGSTTVTAGKGDAIGGLIESEGTPAAADPNGVGAGAADPATVAAAPPAFMPPPVEPQDAANPKQLYETAYGYLMQRDYGAAQAAFEDFLSRYPNDSLAGNAQYWLGEAHFVRGDFKAAAGAFLKGYQDYAGNARAADSLLRLAMSLDRLGQRDAACSSYSELGKRFPDAPENVKASAHAEQNRIGCQ